MATVESNVPIDKENNQTENATPVESPADIAARAKAAALAAAKKKSGGKSKGRTPMFTKKKVEQKRVDSKTFSNMSMAAGSLY
jgi:hypothetical protein